MTVECERTFAFAITDNATAGYIDLAQCLSAVNRKLYRQGKVYYVSKIQWISGANLVDGDLNKSAKLSLATLPYNWVMRNAWVKAFNLWKEMNKKVLKDNPSVQGKWADYKVFFDAAHFNGNYASAGPALNLIPIDAGAANVDLGEWYMTTYVSPQHNVDPTTGVPEDADEFKVHMLGDDVAGTADEPIASGAIIQAYQNTRAQVRTGSPEVPAAMSTSWMTTLTDDGSQEPELADVLEDSNDAPPYDNDEYPGAAGNFNGGVFQTMLTCTLVNQTDTQSGFPVPLGLIKVGRAQVTDSAGGILVVTLMPGKYHGVMATDVKQ